MACNDRQLTEAQRQAGFGQQRSGVNRAIRPFSGSQTLENLIDYVNRELGPALRATRDACNDVFLQVADNAPSANPLAFYFSTSTAAADPTVGRMRLNQAVQNTATVIRVSESNGRLQSVQPWLDVMSGGPTTPLGTLTMVDAINPSRFLRFDLNTMTDQGAYWDLGVTIIESSDTNPFVEDEPVVIGFIAGVSAAGSTVPVGSLSPVARDTFLGNIGTTTAAPSAVPLANVDSTSIVYDGTAHEFQRAALTSEVTAAQNVNALVVTRSTNFQSSPWTGIHQFNNELRLGTLHTEASVSGALNITLTAGATRVLITSTADVTLGTISGCADGRVLFVEHAQASGTGALIVTHGTTTDTISCPGSRTFVVRERGGFTLVGRGTSWKVQDDNPDAASIQSDGTGGGNNFALLDSTSILLVTANATYTGFARANGNKDGDRFFIQTDSGVTATLPFNSGSSSSGNRVASTGGITLTIPGRGLVLFVYRALLWRAQGLGNPARLIKRSTITSADASISVTPDPETTWFRAEFVAAGGGGGGADADSDIESCAGAGGGAGAYNNIIIPIVSGNITGSVGAAGTAGAATGGTGGTGGSTVLTYNSTSYTATGGTGGTGTSTGALDTDPLIGVSAQGLGGTPDATAYGVNGGDGHPGLMFSLFEDAAGQSQAAIGGVGGASFYGGGGQGGSIANALGGIAGDAGRAPGSGGGGAARIANAAATGFAGGAGAPGAMVIEEWSGPVPAQGTIS